MNSPTNSPPPDLRTMALGTLAADTESDVLLRDPEDGAAVRVLAGGRAGIEWEFSNHAPMVRLFELECEGLVDTAWLSSDSLLSLALPAHGGGVLRLVLEPPADVTAVSLPIQARIQSEGQLIHATALQLEVVEAPEPNSEPNSEPEDAPTVFDEHLSPEPERQPEPRATQVLEPSTPAAAPIVVPAATRESELRLVGIGARAAAEEHAVQNVHFDEPNVLEAPQGALISLRPGETLLLRFEFANETARARTFVLEDDRSLDVDWITTVQGEVNISRDQSDELSLRLHPPTSARPGDYPFSVRLGPEGGTLLSRNLTLRIQPAPAVSLRCNAPRLTVGPFHKRVDFALLVESAGNADTAFRLSTHAPLVEFEGQPSTKEEAPARGPFILKHLLRSRAARSRSRSRVQVLEERRVAPRLRASSSTPPLALAAPEPRRVVSPGSLGQSSRVLAAHSAEDEPVQVLAEAPGRAVIYESRRWAYYFDREMDSLESLSPNRPPKPRAIRLRLSRKGIWWWGLRERERVRVAAVPVTDVGNGGIGGNALEIEATRWRPYPVPLRLLLPFGILPLLLLTGRPENVMVDNPSFISDSNTYWIVGKPGQDNGALSTKIRWQAPWLSLVTLSGIGDSALKARLARSPQPIDATFAVGRRSSFNVYRVQRLLGGKAEEVKVRFVAASRERETPLVVRDVSGNDIQGSTINVDVPIVGRVPLQLINVANKDYALNYWVAHRPGSSFYINDLNDEGSLRSVALFPPGAPQRIKIERGPGGRVGDVDTLVLITTDVNRPVLYVKLRLVDTASWLLKGPPVGQDNGDLAASRAASVGDGEPLGASTDIDSALETQGATQGGEPNAVAAP